MKPVSKWVWFGIILVGIVGYVAQRQYLHQERIGDTSPASRLTVMATQCSRPGLNIRCEVQVYNSSNRNIRDVKFESKYIGESGTLIDTNQQTIYSIFPAHETKTVEFSDIANPQVTGVNVQVIDAAWMN